MPNETTAPEYKLPLSMAKDFMSKSLSAMPKEAREAFDTANLRREAFLSSSRVIASAKTNPDAIGISDLEAADELAETLAAAEKVNAKIAEAQAAGNDKAASALTATFDELMSESEQLAKIEAAAKADSDRRKAIACAKAAAIPNQFHGATISTNGFNDMSNTAFQHRAPELKAFRNHQAAYAGGMQLKAALGRAMGSPDTAAESFLADHGIRATQRENSATSGGYLTPDPLEAAVIEYRASVGISRQLATVVQMTADTLKVPKQTAGLTVYAPGEANAITASDQTFGQIELSAVKRAMLTKISRELRDDAIVSIADLTASRMGYEFAYAEDSEFVLGDATSTYRGETGLLAAIGSAGVSQAASGHDTWPELDMADVTAWLAKLPSKFQMNTSIVCSSQFYYSVLLRIQASAGGNAIASLQAGDGGRPTFLGKPVFITDFMPTSTAVATVCALYGDFSSAVMIGDRLGFDLAVSEDAYFAEDLIGIRGVTRYDINCHEMGDSTNAGAVVALKTAA